jgi:autotransporter-associated beta strand protein
MLMMTTRGCSFVRVVAGAVIIWLSLFAAGAGQAVAADYYWDVNGTTLYGDGPGIFRSSASGTTWSTSSSGTTPLTFVIASGVGTTSSFQFGFGPAPTNNTNAGTVTIGNSTSTSNQPTVGALIFNASGTSGYTFQNNTSNSNVMSVTLTGSATNAIGSGTGILISNNVTGDTRFIRNPLNTAGAAGIILGKAQTWTNNSTSYALIVNAPIAGAFALTTNGPGAIELGGTNSFSSLNVSAGTVRVTASAGLSSGTVTVGAAGTLDLRAAVTNSMSNSGTVSIGAGGSLTTGSIGTGALSLAGVSGTGASFTSTFAATQAPASVTMSGYATMTLASATSGLLSTGPVSISGLSNVLNVGGVTAAGNTYTLLSGTGMTNSGSITLTGAAIGSQTLAPGDSTTIGRTTYNFNQTATALQLAVTGTTYDLFWNGGPSGAWDYTTANWQKDGAGSNIVFVQGDKATLGTASTITVDSGTFGSSVQAASLTVNNSAGTVALSGSAISTTGTFGKSGDGSLTMSNAATFGAGAWVGAGSMTTSGSMTVSSGGLNVSGGSLAANAATTVTAGGLNVSGGSFTSNAATTVTAGGLNVSGGSTTLNNPSTITGGITLTGGTTALNAANTVSGTVGVSGGAVLSLGNASGAGAGTISISNGTLASSMSPGTVANLIAVGSGSATINNDNALTLTGSITGSGNTLVKSGSGTLTISILSTSGTGDGMVVNTSGGTTVFSGTAMKNFGSTSTFNGPVTLDNASIQLSNNASLAGTGTITTLGISSIDVRASGAGGTKTITAPVSFGSGTASLNSVSSRNLELSGVISGSGNVTTTGIATVRFTTSTQGTFSGTLTANSSGVAGTTQVTTQALGTGSLVTNANPSFVITTSPTSAPLLFRNTVMGEYSGTISGDGVVGSSASTSNRAILSGSNTYTGGTYIWNNIGFKNSSAFGTGTIFAMDSSSRINNDATTTLSIANPISITSGMLMAFTGSSVTRLTGTLTGDTSTILRASTGGTIDLTQQSSATMNTFSGLADIGGAGATMWTTGDVNFGNASAISFSGTPGAVVDGTATNQVSVLVAKAANVSISKSILIGTGSTAATYYATFDTGTNAMSITGTIADRVGDGTNPSSGGVIKIGSGSLTLSAANTYTQGTTVSEGLLLVNGSLATGTVSVLSAAVLGGSGTIGSSIVYDSGANFAFDPLSILTVNGAAVSFGGFGVNNLTGLDSNTAEGTYTLMSGSTVFDLANVSNVGASNAYSLGDGKTAYLQTASGPNSFMVVVVPEPTVLTAAACGGLIALLMARRGRPRRRATDKNAA